jgi:DNA primase
MDVIDFVMHKENTDKHHALLKCAEIISYYEGKLKRSVNPDTQWSGVQHRAAAATTSTPVTATVFNREQFLGNMFTYFKNAVHNSKPAQEYLRKRCLDPLQIEVGYNTAQFHHGERKDDTLISNCVAVGLLSPWGTNTREGGQAYRPFGKYCIVFALRDSMSQVVSLYFRSTVNDQDQRHFYLRDRQGLYPGYPKGETTRLILTESIIDAATLLQVAAITDAYSVLALYGTNGLTDEHVGVIKELPQLTEIILWLNADEAGEAAANKYAGEFKILLPAVKITGVSMPAGEDINSLAQTHNREQIFIDLLNERKDFSILSVAEGSNENGSVETKKGVGQTAQQPVTELDTSNALKIKYSTQTANYYIQGGLPKAMDNMKVMLVVEEQQTMLKARNRIDLYEDKQVERLCVEIAEKLSLRKDLLAADLYRLTDLLDNYRERQAQTGVENNQQTAPVLTAKERQELEAFARQPKLIKRLNELLGHAGIVGEERNRIFLLVIAISHKMGETLHALIQGSSGSGKTRLLKQVSDCMPLQSVTRLTRLSDKVLYNFPEHYFVNRLLCLEDIDGLSEEAEFAFRELQSNGELNSATSIKLENGQITSGQKTVKGPIASLACTTHGEIYEDNMSRVFLVAVDESTRQTERIIEYQNSVSAGLINREEEQQARAFIRKLICMLQPYEVINPYARQLQLPPEAHKIRRLNDLFQSFVKMITIINQYQRRRDAKKRLIAEVEDIETAVAVMFESIVLKVDELDGSLRQFYEQLKTYLQKGGGTSYQNAQFSLREIRQALKLSKTQVFRYASDLLRLEYIQQCGGHANKGFMYKISYWDNYQGLREKIRQRLDEQVKSLMSETLRNAAGTLEPA